MSRVNLRYIDFVWLVHSLLCKFAHPPHPVAVRIRPNRTRHLARKISSSAGD